MIDLCTIATIIKDTWFYGLIIIGLVYKPQKDGKPDLLLKGLAIAAWILFGILAGLKYFQCIAAVA